MLAVETRNLTKSFKGFKAVDGLGLKVPEGSVYGFLGPNGAGKTTTIKMLTGLSKPTTGEIFICGKPVVFGNLGNKADIGFLPDVPNYYDWMRPNEYLLFAGELFGIDRKILMDRIENLMSLVGLEGVKKRIGSFSRGMKQRLGIAQALINEPKVVFLDEPTSALDPIGRKEVMDIIEKLSGRVTVFFSTHILSDIERVCDRVVILNKGKAVLEDSIVNIRKQYAREGIALEIDGGANVKSELADMLRRQEWADEVPDVKNGEIKVYVKDIQKAKTAIPRLLHEKEIALNKFAVLEPTLEDIFLKVVNEG